MNRLLPAALTMAALLAASCATNDPVVAERYRLNACVPASGEAASAAAGTGAPVLRIARIRAPDWLASDDMFYRLDYADPQSQARYARARWVAPPTEMIVAALRGWLAADVEWRAVIGPDADAQADRVLSVRLDELVQGFDSTEHSYASVRATLLVIDATNDSVLAQRDVSYRVDAKGADAPSGVDALSRAVDRLCADAGSLLHSTQ